MLINESLGHSILDLEGEEMTMPKCREPYHQDICYGIGIIFGCMLTGNSSHGSSSLDSVSDEPDS
jgi:hypothetical protein